MRNKKISEMEVLKSQLDRLDKELNNLYESYSRLSEAFEFVVCGDKNEVRLSLNPHTLTLDLCYLSSYRVVRVGTTFLRREANKAHIIQNNNNTATIRLDMLIGAPKYYMLDKAEKTITEIPKPAFVLEQELAEKKSVKKEKTSGNKKKA